MNTFLLKILMAVTLLAGVSYSSDYAFVDVISGVDGDSSVAGVLDREYVSPSGSGGGTVTGSGSSGSNGTVTGSGSSGSNGSVTTGGTNSTYSGSGGGLQNPLKSKTITGFLLTIIEVLLIFALPIIVLFIMYAGFLYVTARGDEGKIKTAHAALTWSIVGGVIVLGAELIINIIQTTVESI